MIEFLADHPYMEWGETMEMWRISDKKCCLCAAPRTLAGGIAAMLCPSCILLGKEHEYISTELAMKVRAALNVSDDAVSRSARGHFSFPVDTNLLHAIHWGHPVARRMGRSLDLVTVQC